MSKREDYEHLEREVDGSYYWWINDDVKHLSHYGNIIEVLDKIAIWFYTEESKVISLYYKCTRLYFTFMNVKYYLSWVFYSKKLIDECIKRLNDIGAINIQINYGELD